MRGFNSLRSAQDKGIALGVLFVKLVMHIHRGITMPVPSFRMPDVCIVPGRLSRTGQAKIRSLPL
jgi:hypothetical protein